MRKKFNIKIVKNLLIVIFSSILINSCTCANPLQVTPIQRSDKNLDCGQIILEIAEAEQYRNYAIKQKGISMGEALMPVCWAAGYMDGGKAADRANERIEYLGRLYDTRGCVNEGRPFFQKRVEQNNFDDDGESSDYQNSRPNQSYAPNYQNYSPQQGHQNNQNFSRQPNYSNRQNNMNQQQYMGNPQNTAQPNSSQYNMNRQNYARPQQFQAQPYPTRQPAFNANSANSGNTYYKLKSEFGDDEMHEHKNDKGEIYTHFHPHNAPHVHDEDK